jgi:two-component system response regulator
MLMRSLGEPFDGIYVDDDRDDQLLFEQAMKDMGFPGTIHFLESAEELFEYLSRHRSSLPDIIFLDIHLPLMDGLDAFEKIRSDPNLRGIIVVLVTGEQSYTDFVESHQADIGSSGILCKPLKEKKLQQILETYGCWAAA